MKKIKNKKFTGKKIRKKKEALVYKNAAKRIICVMTDLKQKNQSENQSEIAKH